MIIYLLIPFIVLLFYSLSIYEKPSEPYLYGILGCILVLFAGLRHPGIDADSLNYTDFVKGADTLGPFLRSVGDYMFNEPAYYFLASFVKTLGLPVTIFFLIFSILSISLKFIAIRKLSPFYFLSVLVFCSNFFFLHEMTQIRSGIASGFILLSVPYIQEKRIFPFLAMVAGGMCFHYSTIVVLPFYFLDSLTLNKVKYLSFILVPYLLKVIGFNIFDLLSDLHLGVFSDKLKVYNDLLQGGEFNAINIFNVELLLQIFICIVFIYYSESLLTHNKYSMLLIKIYVLSVSFYVFLSSIPVFAFRVGGLLGIVEIILIPFLIYLLRPRLAGFIMVIGISVLLFFVSIFYARFLQPYSMF